MTIRDVSNCVWFLPNPLPMEPTVLLFLGTMQSCAGVVSALAVATFHLVHETVCS